MSTLYPIIKNYELMSDKNINNKLSKVDICKLTNDTGIPFNHITDREIENCLKQNVFLSEFELYNPNSKFLGKNDKLYDVLKIATIVNSINNNCYNYAYPIVVWEDSEKNNASKFDTNDNGLHQIRAFYYCQKDIYLSVCHSG
jgi:hypothetical protein